MSDFCYSKLTIDQIGRQAALMDRMIVAQGVDVAALRSDPDASWVAARLKCIDCGTVPACKQWLASAEMGSARQPADFCPNQSLFGSCAGKRSDL